MVSVRSNLVARSVFKLLAVSVVFAFGAPAALQAADLNPYAYKGDPNSPYNDRDPRYAELYGPDDHYDKRRRHAKPYGRRAEVHRDYEYKDRKRRYDLYRDPRHYKTERTYRDERRYHHDRYARPWRGRFALAPHCVPRRVVMRRLFRNGWHDFHGLELRGHKANVRARSDDGRLFALTIERCSGEIIAARQIEYRHTNGYDDRRAFSEIPYRYHSYK